MDDLVQFLRDRLDQDERDARAATPGPWRDHDTHLGQYGYTATVLSGEGNGTDLRAWLPSMSQEPWDETRNVWADAAHIARHDPARVLREVEGKRLILERFADLAGENWKPSAPRVVRLQELRDSVRCLALAYADHPDYRDDWRP